MRAAGMILLSALVLSGVTLPKKGPLPEARPTIQGDQPTPTPKPLAPRAADDQATGQGKTGTRTERDLAPDWKDDALDALPEAKETVVEIKKEDPEAYASCLSALKSLGSAFAEASRIDDGKGCGIDKPIDVTEVLPGVSLKSHGKMRCETALALARWTKESVLPAVQTAFGANARVTALNQASTYVCRPRNNETTGEMSEHARGNAVDIASFTFGDGKTIEIQPRDEDGTLPAVGVAWSSYEAHRTVAPKSHRCIGQLMRAAHRALIRRDEPGPSVSSRAP
ncbi:extensin family protein [Sinorhizobium numidicum]|uniref:Extensin family protein n=1 Tax=Sinorhizobium numidicum TaxID=680248 RepID=A0ABY8CQ40_9HYPH|nr:extensin family protein [Sinorhizobium numidicum]WEX74754.1 extensin family protein [Sinorhizobium numidicum]WEX80745.1 extensin family protein [Sinorhizobium numidicum]